MGAAGIWMLALTAVCMSVSGLPAWIVLIGASMLFALGGLAFGAFTAPVLFALPSRLLGLLEHDLLQALPLYVLIGVLLNRLPVADSLFRVANRIFRHSAAAPYLSGMGLGILFAPINGSVGASVSMLARTVQPRLDALDAASGRSAALICAASTVGVVVPPSLVLILLGDAMMRAHTEAARGVQSVRIINTQDVFHGALAPAAALVVLFIAIAWWRNRNAHAAGGGTIGGASQAPPAGWRDWITAGVVVSSILALLVAVTLGYLYAVEGAAAGCLGLLVFGVAARSLTWPVFKSVLEDALSISGALFALLVAATGYTLVLRAFETDLWMNVFLSGFGGHGALIVVLLVLVLSAFILDALEIIFVIVPVVMPSLLAQEPDAIWVSALTLLVLQASFLLPPFGYAILMAGSVLRRKLNQRSLARELLPYLAAQGFIVLLVLLWPNIIWRAEPAAPDRQTGGAQLTDEQVQQAFEQNRLQNESGERASEEGKAPP